MLHETHKVVGWPIPITSWTAFHYTLFHMVEEKVRNDARGRKVRRGNSGVFERALANTQKQKRARKT